MTYLYGLITEKGFERLEREERLRLWEIEKIVGEPGKKTFVAYLAEQFSDKYIELVYDDDLSFKKLPITCKTPGQIEMLGQILVTGSNDDGDTIALTEEQFDIAKNELILVSI